MQLFFCHGVTRRNSTLSFFLLSTEGSLVIIRAYQPYTLVGPLVLRLILDPQAVYSSRTVYI